MVPRHSPNASASPWPGKNTADGLPDTRTIRLPSIWARSLKHEEVYLRAYATVSEARASIGRYLDFYNRRRPHQGLAAQTPDQAFINALQPIPAAA